MERVSFPFAEKTFDHAEDAPYQVIGHDCAIVHVPLATGEKVVCEPGAMMYTSNDVQPRTFIPMGLRTLGAAATEESLFKTEYTNESGDLGYIGITCDVPGAAVPVRLSEHPEGVLIKKGCWIGNLGDEKAVEVSAGLPHRGPLACCFSGLELWMQSLRGEGTAFINAGGTILEANLEAGEKVIVDTNSILGLTQSVNVDIRVASDDPLACCFGGEGIFNTELTGPGTVWLESMSIEKLRALFPAPSAGGGGDGGGGDGGGGE